MSNDLIDMSAFQGARPAAAFASLPQESLADGIGQSYAILSYRGKTWSLRHRSETKMFLRRDDQSPVSYLDVVILRQAPNKSKSYYAPGSYDPANPNTSPPLCASLDGIKPDPDVTAKQADACALCPHNQFKTMPDGRKRRDCSDFKRLAVFLLPSSSMLAINEVLIEPVFLRVPPASLDPLAKYGESLAKMGWPFASVVTRITFDPTEPHPKMLFKAIKPLTDKDANAVLGLREDSQAKRITGEEGRPVPVNQSALAQPVSAPQVAHSPAPAPSNVVSLTGLQQGGPANQAPATGQVIEGTVVARTVVDTPPADGLIAAAVAGSGAPVTATVTQSQQPQQQQVIQPAPQTAADVGNSDADLDNQIASILMKK